VSLLCALFSCLTNWSLKEVTGNLSKLEGKVGKNLVKESLYNVFQLNRAIKSHVKIQLLITLINQAYFYQIPALLVLGETLLVLCNYASIKMIDVVPFPQYLVFPILSLVIIIVVLAMFPLAVQVFESSTTFLRQIKSLVGRHKIMRAQVRSQRPCRIGIGQLFYAKRSTKCTYFDNCIQFTVDALLLY